MRVVSELLRGRLSGTVPLWVHPEWEHRFPWLAQGITGRARGEGAPGTESPSGEDPHAKFDPADFALFRETGPTAPADRWLELAGANGFPAVVHSRQIHEALVLAHAGREEEGLRIGPAADGHVTATPGVLMAVTVADCVPVYLADRVRKAVGMVHAGWRGTAAGILEEAIGHMGRAFGSEAGDLTLHLGPSICGECYEVGPEVHTALGLPEPGRNTPVDLPAVLIRQALGAGVREEEITRSAFCTLCGGSPFFSHRGGDPERQVGFLGIRLSSGAGLCGTCRWTRIIENRRGSRFFLCRRSESDATFPRYPQLPVLECRGFEGTGS